jgi:hypothetical protein
MGRFGFPGLIVALLLIVSWLVPLAAGIWAVFTLHRIRTTQDAVRATLESIEKLLQRA